MLKFRRKKSSYQIHPIHIEPAMEDQPVTVDKKMTQKRQPKQPTGVVKFRLLMWKNFLQQWRHPGQTFAELLIPVVIMALVLILRWQIEPTIMDTVRYPPIRASSLEFSLPVLAGMNITRMSVAYSPRSEILEDVVRTATAKMVLKNAGGLIPIILEQLPNITNNTITIPESIHNFTSQWNITLPETITIPDWNITIPDNITISENSEFLFEILKNIISVTAYNASADLRTIYGEEMQTRKVIAAVEFDDSLFGATELPSDLRYALRFPERPRLSSFLSQGGRNWRTDLVFPIFELPGPRFPYSWEGGNDPGYVNEMFIAVQHMISTELITRYTGVDFSSFNFSLQRYPHPPYIQDLAVETLVFLFPTFVVLSYSYCAINIVRAIVVEKELQLKEIMKIMGLPTWLHWNAWFWKQFVYLMVTALLILPILKVNWFVTEDGFSEYAIFTDTPWHVLLFFFALYMICTILFCFMVSGFFSKGCGFTEAETSGDVCNRGDDYSREANSAALFTGVLWFLTGVPAFVLSMDVNMSWSVQIFTCLSINSAMAYGFQLILGTESRGGMNWGNFFNQPSADSTRLLFGHIVIMLIVDCFIYLLVALYLEQVLPGPYGTPKKWYFFVQKSFWVPSKDNGDVHVEVNDDYQYDVTKEKDPSGHSVGVKMTDLTKVYGPNIAVNRLTLNIYDDQITVLLGHNGAGKSTTISMLTGNVEITRGSVTVAGFDIAKQTQLARTHLGLCPQHNVLFNELTVYEHLEFYSRLKGFSGEELRDEIDSMIAKLELDEKRNYQAQGLSGGQKRRLQVGIALCGAARVVLLDEPTSGMDPSSRRALWELLQKEKEGRSMILTTHFMDEADILGDRVAIMASGRLQCVGSPYFLKRHYGVGYTLVVVKKDGFDVDACTELLSRHIPGTMVKEDRGTEVTYNLLNEYSHAFEVMLKELEQNIHNIKFVNYGLTATTLEDVFMSVGSDVNHTSAKSDDETATITESTIEELPYDFDSTEQLNGESSITGIKLLWNHVLAIWMKLWLVWTRSWALLLIQLLVPILLMNATLLVMQYITSLAETIQRRELTLTEGFARTETLLHFNGTVSTSLGSLAKAAYDAMYEGLNLPSMELTVVDTPLDEYYLNRSTSGASMGTLRNQLLIGATFADNSTVAWFSNFGYHDVAISLTTVHSAILRALSPGTNLTVYNHPLEANYANQNNLQFVVQMTATQIASGIGNTMGIVSATFVMFYIKERVSRAKLLQKAAGISPVVMWLSAAVFDWLWFLLINASIIVSCAAYQVIGLSTVAELGRMYLLVMLYGAAIMPFNYVFSYFFNGPGVGFVAMFFVNTLLGMTGSQIVEALYSPFLTTQNVADIMDSILQFFPLYSFATAMRTLHKYSLTEYSCLESCDLLVAILPNISVCDMDVMCGQFPDVCCIRPDAYWDWETPGVLRYVVCLLASCAVLWAVLMVAEYRLVQKIFNRTRQPPPIDPATVDDDVLAEAEHVTRVGKGLSEHTLIAKNLSKYYGKHLAVDQVSFTVSDTECFGLLGVNGAGKTTTFKMLMGDETISYGDASVAGHSVKTDITRVYKNIGYCPQFDAVFNELTGREILKFFSMLRGLPPDSAFAQTEMLAHALGFTKHLDKKVEQYSGGNKRKLSTAVALLGRTRLIFVDEPTTGVDPAAKRQVWSAVRWARRKGRGVVLTSHSMEECEALCSRLTIMVNGKFQCLGTPQHLKNKFSQGFTLIIKMKFVEEAAVSDGMTVAIKHYVGTHFANPKIMEEYQGLITYYLPDRHMPWSRMFGVMELAKRELNVEDYSISQTTLEQIFLQFTKYQKQENKKNT